MSDALHTLQDSSESRAIRNDEVAIRSRTRLGILEEIRADITPIHGYLDLYRSGDVTAEGLYERLDLLLARVNRMNTLLRRLLELAEEELRLG